MIGFALLPFLRNRRDKKITQLDGLLSRLLDGIWAVCTFRAISPVREHNIRSTFACNGESFEKILCVLAAFVKFFLLVNHGRILASILAIIFLGLALKGRFVGRNFACLPEIVFYLVIIHIVD